jgi:hypothetical protein
VFLWFVGTAVLTVWWVFRDPRFDYRLLVVGSLLPDIDAVTGGMWLFHTLIFSVGLLVAVMLATAGRKPARKLLLGLPIGTFLHLVFDGAWATTSVFWWPFGGVDFGDYDLPSVQRGPIDIVLEVAGLAMVVWIWRRSNLSDPAQRRRTLSTGQLFVGEIP